MKELGQLSTTTTRQCIASKEREYYIKYIFNKRQNNITWWSHEGPRSNNTPEERTAFEYIPLSYMQTHSTKTTFQNDANGN
jgi:hypothetical protein